MIPIDILYLVDRLEALLNKSSVVPLTTKRLVEEDEFLDIIDQMRVAIPEEIKNARRVSQERERTLAQAKEEADRITALAREEAAQFADDHAIVRAAQARAVEIQQQAEEEARNTRNGADEYALQVLTDLQARLDDFSAKIAALQTTIYNGIRIINDKAAPTTVAPPPAPPTTVAPPPPSRRPPPQPE